MQLFQIGLVISSESEAFCFELLFYGCSFAFRPRFVLLLCVYLNSIIWKKKVGWRGLVRACAIVTTECINRKCWDWEINNVRRQPSQFKCVYVCTCCAYACLGVVKSTQKVLVEREIERECNMSLWHLATHLSI